LADQSVSVTMTMSDLHRHGMRRQNFLAELSICMLEQYDLE